jgi:hypothetical protein
MSFPLYLSLRKALTHRRCLLAIENTKISTNEKSVLGGFPPITRYHATDCAGLKREFSEPNGWDIDRQMKLTKRLCQIIGDESPIGIVVGGRLSDMNAYRAALQKNTGTAFSPQVAMASLYDLCFCMSLMTIVAVVREQFPGTQVDVKIDQGKNFAGVARTGSDALKQDETVPYLKDCFGTLLPEDSTPTKGRGKSQPIDEYASALIAMSACDHGPLPRAGRLPV